MVHCGFEPSAVDHAFSSPRGMLAMLRASLFGPRIPAAPARKETRTALPVVGAETGPSRGLAREATPEVLRQAFEYRGHVTLELAGGAAAEGYVANLHDTDLELWTKDDGVTRSIPTAEVRRVVFSGRDTAAGQGYDAWLRKQAERGAAPSPGA